MTAAEIAKKRLSKATLAEYVNAAIDETRERKGDLDRFVQNASAVAVLVLKQLAEDFDLRGIKR